MNAYLVTLMDAKISTGIFDIAVILENNYEDAEKKLAEIIEEKGDNIISKAEGRKIKLTELALFQ